MEQVEIKLTGFAQVRVSKTMKVSKAHAQVLLADDGAMQALLAQKVNCEVTSWGEVFAKREQIEVAQSEGFTCLTGGCGWVGTEQSKQQGKCPRCDGDQFHCVMEVTSRG